MEIGGGIAGGASDQARQMYSGNLNEQAKGWGKFAVTAPPTAAGILSVKDSVNGLLKPKPAPDIIIPKNAVVEAQNSFNYGLHIQGKLGNRGWSDNLIDNTISNPVSTSAAMNKATGNSATAFFTKGGSYVVRENITGTIIQISDRTDPLWIPDSTIRNPYKP